MGKDQLQRSTDPHFLKWPRGAAHPQNIYNNCFSYAVGDVESVTNYADRMSDVLRQPEPGDAVGMPAKIYTPVHGFNAKAICELAEIAKLVPVQLAAFEALPEPPIGKRLVAMVFLPGENLSTTQYHWLRQGPDGLFTAHIPEQDPSDKDVRGKLIHDPRHSYFSRNMQGPFFFWVPEQGISLKMRAPWDELIEELHMQSQHPKNSHSLKAQAKIFNTMSELVDPAKFPLVAGKLKQMSERYMQQALQ